MTTCERPCPVRRACVHAGRCLLAEEYRPQSLGEQEQPRAPMLVIERVGRPPERFRG